MCSPTPSVETNSGWRRAKIKRLTADDRDRMLKMRAVPDDFDNVQALHSPYGAVHGIATPLQSPIDYASYGEQAMMRPLLVDTIRRHENDEQHLSPTGLSPSFGHVGFAPPGSMSTSDVLSPLSLNSSDRFYGSHQSSPLSAGPRSANTFSRQKSSDTYQTQQHSRHPKPLQPLQLRETISRTCSQSLQSPLRSSMSWKGETLDYAEYQTGAASPTNTRRQQPQYQPDQTGSNPGSSHHYDTNPYHSEYSFPSLKILMVICKLTLLRFQHPSVTNGYHILNTTNSLATVSSYRCTEAPFHILCLSFGLRPPQPVPNS